MTATCPQCHAAVQPGERFCGECGTAVAPSAPTEEIRAGTCAQCGAPLAPGERFCGNCGALAATTAPSAGPPSPPAAPPPLGPDRATGPRPSRRAAIVVAGLVVALAGAVVLITTVGDEVERVKETSARGEAAARQGTQTAAGERTEAETRTSQEEQTPQGEEQAQDQGTDSGQDSGGGQAPSAQNQTTPPGLRSCGGGVSANSVTTCPFAQNVKDAYYNSGRSGTVSAYSPALGRSIAMSCTADSPHVCTGGNNAEVQFP